MESDQTFTNSNNNTLLVRCSCGAGCWCGELGFTLCDEEDHSVGFWAEVLIGPLWEWKRRFERIWDILLGRPFSMYMCISKKDSKTLADWIISKQDCQAK